MPWSSWTRGIVSYLSGSQRKRQRPGDGAVQQDRHLHFPVEIGLDQYPSASKGDQSGKSTTDVGSGAGSQSRAADTHLIIRQHEQEDVAVMRRRFEAGRLWIGSRFAGTSPPGNSTRPTRASSGRPRERTSRENKDMHLNEDRQTIVNAMVHEPGLQTKTDIRDAARVGNPRFGYAWASLLADKTIIPSGEITKGNNRKYESFTLSHQEIDQ